MPILGNSKEGRSVRIHIASPLGLSGSVLCLFRCTIHMASLSSTGTNNRLLNQDPDWSNQSGWTNHMIARRNLSESNVFL